MRAVAGAIMVLAGAVMLGGGVIARALYVAGNRLADWTTDGIMFGGLIVGLIGIGVLFVAVAKPGTEHR